MLTGKLIRLVHLSQQSQMMNTRLIADHNDRGYGIIEDEAGKHVYFLPEAVAGRDGFANLRPDQVVEYNLESTPYLRANAVYARGDAEPRTLEL